MNHCPDAEALAAWTDGGLRQDERARIEQHAAECARCQAHLAAMARMSSADGIEPSEKRVRLWAWLIPATGAVAALGLWFLVQPVRTPPVPAEPQRARIEAERDTSAASPLRIEPRQEAIQTRPAVKDELQSRDDKSANRERRQVMAPPPPASASSRATQARESAPAREETALSARARVAADAFDTTRLKVRRLSDGQVTWDKASAGIATLITSGSSPSPSVFWLAGRGGLVLVSTDGETWRRVRFPESVDLTAITATSDTAATVTTADARTFTTSDGGLSWSRR